MSTAASEAGPAERGWLAGITRATPIVLGYLPIGLAFGVLAQKAGLSPLNTMMMSLIVYAGSAQLIAVGLFAAGVPALSIVFTTFVVNLRHMLMSAALSPFLQRWRKVELAAFAYQLTDETFAVHSAGFAFHPPVKSSVFATNATSQLAWLVGTWLGIIVGQLVTDVRPLGLDYALPAMFIALLVVQVKDYVQIIVALLSGVLAVGLLLLGVTQWYVMIATLVAATAGLGFERWINDSSC